MTAVGATRHLLLFESEELVARIIRSKGGSLNDSKVRKRARSVAAHVRQGRQFLEQSRTSDMAIRPILQYYGLVALSRGMTVVHRDVSPDALKPAHGVKFSISRSNGLEDSNIEVGAKGTVPEIMTILDTFNYVLVDQWSHYEPENPRDSDSAFVKRVTFPAPQRRTSTSFQATLRDILARIPEVEEDYRSIFESDPSHFRCQVMTDENHDFAEILIRRPMDQASSSLFANPDSARDKFGLPKGYGIHVAMNHTALGIGEYMSIVRREELGSVEWPLLHTSAEDRTYILHALPDQSRVSVLPLMLCGSFALSSIARYHPERWRDVIYGMKDDRLLPIIHSLMRTIDNELVEAISVAFGLARVTLDMDSTVRRVLTDIRNCR